MWLLFPPSPTGESFCSHSEQCPVCEVSSGKALQGSSSAEERSFWNAQCFCTYRSNLSGFGFTSCLMKSHVNSGRGSILKFFLHKSSRGIQQLVLKYQGWNLKRSFYYFGGFPAQSWARLIIFLCLSLFTAKQSCPCVLFLEKVKNYFFEHIRMRELSFTVCGAPKSTKWVLKN